MHYFVLGNGRSRLQLDLKSLDSKVFGCNKLFLDFSPDVLIATDPEITREVERTGYALQHEFYTRYPKAGSGAKLITKKFGYASGPIALAYAASEDPQIIYMFGFDFVGIDGKHNNVYSGSSCYKTANDEETFYGNWVEQIDRIMRENPNVLFYHMLGESSLTPFEYLPNYETFRFTGPKYSDHKVNKP